MVLNAIVVYGGLVSGWSLLNHFKILLALNSIQVATHVTLQKLINPSVSCLSKVSWSSDVIQE